MDLIQIDSLHVNYFVALIMEGFMCSSIIMDGFDSDR
jgi:hypothetical protein